MSDQALPPYTQSAFPPPPYDDNGRPWFPGSDGNWAFGSGLQQPPHYSSVAGMPASAAQQQQQPRQYSSAAGTSASAAQVPSYNFPPSTQTSAIHPRAHPASNYPPISLLPPLPDQEDRNLSDPAAIARSHGLAPAKKVAGVCHKDPKGKKRNYSSDSDTDEEPITKRGRRKGSLNFSKDDVTNLLDNVDKRLPLGQKGWKAVAVGYAKRARNTGRPERDVKSLEAKYKQLLKTKKPTGSGQCPPEIKRAHEIEAKINHRADTRELSDSDDDGANASDNSIEVLDQSAVHTAIAQRAPTPPLPPRRNSRMNAPELVNKLSQAFDPDALRARDEERGQRSFQTTQIFMMSQQIQDAQATIKSLHRAEMALSWYQDGYGKQHRRRVSRYANQPGLVRVDGKIRNERVYPDGGACTTWDTAPSSDESDKENKDPSSSSSHMSFATRSPSPFNLHDSVSYPPPDPQGSDNNAASSPSTSAGGAK
ncbi:hypothetical protein DFH07DRAFT_965396 [Mycena maculata]|uniref:DUF6818 domain-containing protein n=1 Tax=Mycena maculata TaxID=230809 RepID=A0AAD7ICT5_9AGAR|nr:hypothetical protein DFH07DRAFT_965396 [Mycena maculata]